MWSRIAKSWNRASRSSTQFAPLPRLVPTPSLSSAKSRFAIGSGKIIGLAGIWREANGPHAPGPAIRSVSQALETMHRRFGELLSISELARSAGLSRNQLGRQFQRLFRTSPSEYLLRVRIDAACHLLIETERKITDIAQEIGFFDHSHFSRTFQRLRRIRPQAYHRRHTVQ